MQTSSPSQGAGVFDQTSISVRDGVLTLHRNLQRADYNTFQNACAELRTSALEKATLDLGRCTYMNSMFVGVLVDVVTQMKMDGRTVVVWVSPELGRFLHMAHLYHLFTYQIVDLEDRDR